MSRKEKVLFLCTHNSARSQIAEGMMRHLYNSRYDVFSAGTKPAGLNPYVVRAMEEQGIDMSAHSSKSVNELNETSFDYIVTVCDNAREACPYIPGGSKYLHHSFEDPSKLKGTDEEIMSGVRRIRDEIKEWLESVFSR